jgi:hypothetical protein
MSKLVVPLLAVVCIGLGATAAWQNQQLSAERLRALDLSNSIAKIEARAAELEKDASRLRDANGIFQSESEQLRKKLADRSGGGATGDGVAPVAAEEAQEGGAKKEKGGFMQTMAKMFTDPEMKKAMRGQQAMGVRMMYTDLAKELGLNPEEADQVIELLTDRQLAMTGKSMELMNGGKRDEAKMAELGQEVNASREEFDKQIENVLGKDRYSKLQNYERTLGERVAMTQLQQQFAARGMTLEEPQRQNLLQAMVDERLKAPSTPWDANKPDVAGQMRAMSSDETMNGFFEQQKQINSRVLVRAREFLSPDQVNALQQSQEQQLQMQQFGMKMGREMLGK